MDQAMKGERSAVLHDADIRDDLCWYLEERYGKVRFFDELSIGRSRADIVVVTEAGLIGVEIKSDADTYARLDRQVKDYDHFFDQNYVAVGTSHAHHVHEHLPAHWGILTIERVEEGLDFYVLREPQTNPKVTLARQLSLLWRRELAYLQQENGLYRYPGKGKAYVRSYLMDRVDHRLLKKQMIDVFFERDYSQFDE